MNANVISGVAVQNVGGGPERRSTCQRLAVHVKG